MIRLLIIVVLSKYKSIHDNQFIFIKILPLHGDAILMFSDDVYDALNDGNFLIGLIAFFVLNLTFYVSLRFG